MDKTIITTTITILSPAMISLHMIERKLIMNHFYNWLIV